MNNMIAIAISAITRHGVQGPGSSHHRPRSSLGQPATLFLVRDVLPDIRVPLASAQVAGKLFAEVAHPRFWIHVPEKQVAIAIARYQRPAIGTEGQYQHPTRMAAQGVEWEARFDIPKDDSLIACPRGKHSPVLTE